MRKFTIALRVCMLIFCVSAPMHVTPVMAQAADTVMWGVNAHPINNPVFADYEKQFQIMRQNHLTTYRMNVSLTRDNFDRVVTQTRILVGLAKKYGVTLRPVLELPFTWGDRTDAGLYPAGDTQVLYEQGFNRTYDFVILFKDDIQDWELQNELNLRVKNAVGKQLYGYGWTAQEFDTPLMRDWAAVLKGMSDAIEKINKTSGVKLRRILGTTSTMFGFIDFMQAQGVAYDVVGYHYYAPLDANPYQSWSKATPPFDLFAVLAGYGKPVHVTEVNAAEIYDAAYQNTAGDANTEKGFRSLTQQLTYLKNQKEMNLEEVDVYDFLDDPAQPSPENRFGVMYDLDTPKQALSILGAIAAP